ncbi:MAG: MFS transporter [Actinomycetota bacterium]
MTSIRQAPSTEDGSPHASVQRRTLGVLFAGAVFARGAISLSFAVAVLLIEDMLGSSRWAGMSTVAITVGTALSAAMLSSFMDRRGRRPGLTLGYVLATAGGALALFSAEQQYIVLFLIGMVLIGMGAGTSNLARYAAADLATPETKAKAISFIVFASTVGAVGGPILVGLADDIGQDFGLRENVGPNALTGLFFGLAAIVMYVALRPDPLVLIDGLRKPSDDKKTGFVATLRLLWSHPSARVALLALVIAQAVMVGVMAMTPLHMRAHGHEVGMIGLVISAHTAGMYAFAPLAGWAADRFGRVATISLGAAVLIVATALTALAGEAPALLMFPGLYLLGLGWSFGMVAGSALLTESVPAEERVSAQGVADLMAAIVSGVAALASGLVLDMAGFHILSMIGILASGIMLVVGFTRGKQLSFAAG